MARKTSQFMVGLFVIVGTAIIVLVIIWIGATRYFEKGNLYITYFDESVHGLERDAEVKFRGVRVGRVEQVTIAPDNRLVGVVMNIFMENDLTERSVAQMTLAGITGIIFINLDVRDPEAPDLSPKLDFAAEYPVIQSKPSDIQRIFSGIEEIIQKLDAVDIAGISLQMKNVAVAMEQFLKGKEMQAILVNMDVTSKHLRDIAAKVDRLLVEDDLKVTLTEAREALTGARELFVTVNREIKSARLPEVSGQTRTMLADVQGLTERLEAATRNMDQLAERLYYHPSDILFGRPPRPRWNER
jgi:phospholipid/cholesterol/gamma-HCH transport system substrate-binding protein